MFRNTHICIPYYVTLSRTHALYVLKFSLFFTSLHQRLLLSSSRFLFHHSLTLKYKSKLNICKHLLNKLVNKHVWCDVLGMIDNQTYLSSEHDKCLFNIVRNNWEKFYSCKKTDHNKGEIDKHFWSEFCQNQTYAFIFYKLFLIHLIIQYTRIHIQ